MAPSHTDATTTCVATSANRRRGIGRPYQPPRAPAPAPRAAAHGSMLRGTVPQPESGTRPDSGRERGSMRIGILGAGRIGAYHARALAANPLVRELVVADIDQ